MTLPVPFISAFFDKFDTNRDGQISFMEFKTGVMSLTGITKEESLLDGEAMIALVSGSQTIPIQWKILGHVSISIVPSSQTSTVCSSSALTVFDLLHSASSSSTTTATQREFYFPVGHSISASPTNATVPAIYISNPLEADISAMLDAHFLPFPRSFILAATLELSPNPLYVWYPIAREHYTALGMVATTSKSPPPLESIRTLPLALTRPSELRPVKLAGVVDPKLSLSINTLGLLVVPTLAGVVLNFELNLSADREVKSLTLQDTFTLTSWR